MQKKIAIILVGGLVACLMGGCGQNEADTVTMAVADEAITEVAEEDDQVEESTEEGDTVEDEETVSDSSTDEPVEEIGDDGTVEGDEFPIIEQGVIDSDKSDEYGIYSISCYDLDQYLDEYGKLQGDDDYERKIHSEYSGRWAYPVFTPCRFFTDLRMTERTDSKEFLRAVDNETEKYVGIFIYSGLSQYEFHQSLADWEGATDTTYMFTAQTVDGETDVIHERREGEGPDDEHEYNFKVASFSVSVFIDGEPLTEEEVQLIVDNIRPTNGLER